MNDVDDRYVIDLITRITIGKSLTKKEKATIEAWSAQSEENKLLLERYQDKRWVAKQLQDMPMVPSEEIWAKILTKTGIEQNAGKHGWRLDLFALATAAIITGVIYIGATFLIDQMYRLFIDTPTVGLTDTSGHRHHRLMTDEIGLTEEDSCIGAVPYDLVLPDSSRVKLAYASYLRYPTQFRGYKRQVWLSGQALFEVTDSTATPLIVHAGKADVMVLSAKFNVMAYPDQVSEITLLKGKVSIRYNDTTLSLLPGRQAIIRGDSLRVRLLEHPDGAIGWSEQNQYMEFDDVNLDEVVKRVAKWYNVKVYNPKRVAGARITGIFLLKNSLDANLDILGDAERWRARVERRNDTIFISPYVLTAATK